MAADSRESTLTRFVRSLRRDRIAGVTAVGVVAALGAVAIGFSGGAHAVLPRISDIGAWLTNDSQGSVTHANGLSGKADTRIGLTNAAGHPLRVTQDGNTVIVIDTVTGKVTRIDPAQLTVTQSVNYGSPNVQIVSGGGKAYVVDPAKGLVQPIDPARLSAVGAPVALRPPLGGAAVDARGTAWVPELSTGQLVPVTGGARGTPVPVGSPGDKVTLTIADGVPVATDTTAATMTVLSPSGRRTVNLPSGAGTAMVAPAATGGSVVPLLATGSHQMVMVDTRDAATTEVTLDGFAGDDLGAPQALGGRVYVPDNSTGRLIVYDSGTGRMLNQVTVSGQRGRIDLFLHDGLLWANDASGSAAVSVDSSGAVHPISKYTPDLPGGPLPTPSRSAKKATGGGPAQGGGAPGRRPGGTGGTTGQGNGGNRPTPGRPTPPSPTPARPTTQPPTTQPPAAPGAAPTGISETGNPGSIVVKFSPSSGATPTSYTLSNVPSGASVNPPSVAPGGPYQFTVTGLSCDQVYTFHVVANYPTGAKENSGGSARPCTAPSAPTGLSLNTGTQSQITASWNRSNGNGGSVTYSVSLKGGASQSTTTTSTTARFTGLKNFRGYTVTVTANNGAGASQPPTSSTKTLSSSSQNGHIYNNSQLAVNERSTMDANSTSNIERSFGANSNAPVTVVCIETGGSWSDPVTHDPSGNTWYRLSKPQAGWVATGYVTGVSNVWSCDGAYGG